MKKILWLCNTLFSDTAITETGGWLQPLAVALQQSGQVQIGNITFGHVTEVTRCNYNGIRQWIIPFRKEKYYGQMPSTQTCRDIENIEKLFQPDLVHIWGTENIWASVYQQGYVNSPALIDIQGLLFAIADYYYGGLTFTEIIKTIRLKEILMPWRTLFHKKKVFKKRGEVEIECLKSFKNISVQSEWVRHHVLNINPDASCYSTKIMLREAFYGAEVWQYKKSDSPIIFSSCSGAVSYKGLHVLLKALAILKRKYPAIKLNIAGTVNIGNKLLDGYSIFLKKLIKQMGLENNVCYLGALNANEIVDRLLNSNVCVIPSFVETYCLAFAESMIVGTPTVVSYAGALPEFAVHNESAMYYNSSDYTMCATHIDQLIQDPEFAALLSGNARKSRLKENNIQSVLDTQLRIYQSILDCREK